MRRAHRLLDRQQSVVVVIDVQEAYRGKTFCEERFRQGIEKLLQVVRQLGVPLLATEQYPRGLGPTLPELRSLFPPDCKVFEKRSLSCWQAAGFAQELRALERSQVVLCGLEVHACVNQTAHDLLARGYEVHLPVDAVASRFPLDFRMGLRKLFQSGVVPATVEMVAFEWLRTAEAPEFKAVQQLFK